MTDLLAIVRWRAMLLVFSTGFTCSQASWRASKMKDKIVVTFRKNQIVVAFIVGGAIIIAIPIAIFGLIRLVYVLGIKEALAPSALKKLEAWRKGVTDAARHQN